MTLQCLVGKRLGAIENPKQTKALLSKSTGAQASKYYVKVQVFLCQ